MKKNKDIPVGERAPRVIWITIADRVLSSMKPNFTPPENSAVVFS